MFRDYTLQTTWRRALVALVGGAVVGAFCILLMDVPFLVGVFDTPLEIAQYLTGELVDTLIYVSAALLIFFTPFLIFANWFGFRTWLSSVLLGFSIPFVVVLMLNTEFLTGKNEGKSIHSNGGFEWIDGELTLYGWSVAAQRSALIALVGATVALTIWRIAYRRPRPNA